jgi:hypothetical protein
MQAAIKGKAYKAIRLSELSGRRKNIIDRRREITQQALVKTNLLNMISIFYSPYQVHPYPQYPLLLRVLILI